MMALGKKRLGLVQKIKEIMSQIGIKMTVRQIYYQLVSKHLIENNKNSYKSFDNTLTLAREENLINPFDIIDTSKPIIKAASWSNLSEFLTTVKDAYRKRVWDNQETYVEVWLEKDALRGIFEPITNQYDVYLVIGKGYQSYTNLIRTTKRLPEGKEIHILYFGDFDPTGLDIPRNIKERLESFGIIFEFHKIALTPGQIKKYDLPPNLTKKTDSRAKGFVAIYGDNTVELDALDPKVLRDLIENSILNYIDIDKYDEAVEQEKSDLSKIQEIIGNIDVGGDE